MKNPEPCCREHFIKDFGILNTLPECKFVLEALQRNDWNVTRAAQDVNIQRPNFQALMRKHAIKSKQNDE
jgi:transcriptional regulator with GAF, ATPase, and Fis domain